MLRINSIRKGIVIDHIKPGYGMKIYEYLKLQDANFTVALIMNAISRKYGRKDMIKIENVIDLDLAMLGFIDPKITVNIIEDEVIKEKINLSLPDRIEGVIECKNPRCITSEEREIVHKFILIDKEKAIY
ncbi:MAG: aspartate carbamoyltransferase regulatory subunit, partial [Tissierellaceae bacterium]